MAGVSAMARLTLNVIVLEDSLDSSAKVSLFACYNFLTKCCQSEVNGLVF